MRHSKWDALLVTLSLVQGVILVLAPSIPVIALGLWWNANTISHNFIHLPFFRASAMNRAYSAYLSVLLGVPQGLWHKRHLSHHRNTPPKLGGVAAPKAQTGWFRREPPRLALEKRGLSAPPNLGGEFLLVLVLWGVLVLVNPQFFLTVYLPGYLAGLGLCYLHGYFEHARGVTSHYGLVYNTAFFNDGFHVEHHAAPREHWTRLPSHVAAGASSSRWPAVIRWIEVVNLVMLERLVLQSKALQRFVLANHEHAFRRLLNKAPEIRTVKIIGGGLFPRSALIVRKLLPAAEVTIVDASAPNIEISKRFLDGNIEFAHAIYEAGSQETADLLIIPLCLIGDRQELYKRPPARAVLFHDWIWRKRGESAVVSIFLLKRINLITS